MPTTTPIDLTARDVGLCFGHAGTYRQSGSGECRFLWDHGPDHRDVRLCGEQPSVQYIRADAERHKRERSVEGRRAPALYCTFVMVENVYRTG